jgi:Ca2+/Na+ antiporter
VRNFFAILKKGVGIVLGTVLLVIGGGIGLEDWQAPGTINIPIMLFSLAAIIVGIIILWLTFKKNENRYTKF